MGLQLVCWVAHAGSVLAYRLRRRANNEPQHVFCVSCLLGCDCVGLEMIIDVGLQLVCREAYIKPFLTDGALRPEVCVDMISNDGV